MLKKVPLLWELASETTLISQGRLDHPLQFEGSMKLDGLVQRLSK
jgi:hypothetical protein